MNNVKSIDIVFENCEEYTFPKEDIGYFEISDIREKIFRCACNAISKYKTAYCVNIELFDTNRFQEDCIDRNVVADVFARIANHNDITQIHIHYKDGTEEQYLVDYNELNVALDAPNKNQKSYISDLGNLYVVISEKEKLEDVFNKEEINDKDVVDFHREMIS